MSLPAASRARTALSCLMTEEKAYGMTVTMMKMVKSKMRRVGMISLISLKVMLLSCLTHTLLDTLVADTTDCRSGGAWRVNTGQGGPG